MRTPAIALAIVALLAAGCTGAPSIHPDSLEEAQTESWGLGLLEGTVTDSNFIPIRDAKVSLKGTVHETQTTWDGKFSFPKLEARTYTMFVEAIGWGMQAVPVEVLSNHVQTISIFLDPKVKAEPYHTLKEFQGFLDCVYVSVLDQSNSFSCNNLSKKIEFPKDWAVTVTEAQWGGNGYSSNAVGVLSLLDENGKPFARRAGNSPTRIDLHPDFIHVNGVVPTPAKGEKAPLTVELYKAPQQLVDGVTAVVTVQQNFKVVHTTFYNQEPADLESYTAFPDE